MRIISTKVVAQGVKFTYARNCGKYRTPLKIRVTWTIKTTLVKTRHDQHQGAIPNTLPCGGCERCVCRSCCCCLNRDDDLGTRSLLPGKSGKAVGPFFSHRALSLSFIAPLITPCLDNNAGEVSAKIYKRKRWKRIRRCSLQRGGLSSCRGHVSRSAWYHNTDWHAYFFLHAVDLLMISKLFSSCVVQWPTKQRDVGPFKFESNIGQMQIMSSSHGNLNVREQRHSYNIWQSVYLSICL